MLRPVDYSINQKPAGRSLSEYVPDHINVVHKATSALNLSNGDSFQFSPVPKSAATLGSQSDLQSLKKIRRSSLPSNLNGAGNTSNFQFDRFARKHFAIHKRGIFRRKIPLEELLEFSRESISIPLLVLDKSVHKNALKSFKTIQRIMGDRARPRGTTTEDEDIHWLVENGIQYNLLRDELYVQLCKQLTKNPQEQSQYKGWEIMAVFAAAFPPSRNFEDYLKNFISTSSITSDDERISTLMRHCYHKLERICKTGPKGKSLTSAEIARAKEAAFKPSPFGENLDFIMEMQRNQFPFLPVPRILVFLAREILRLRGHISEGIFRVPGDADAVTELRIRIENNLYDGNDIKDPNTPASLLKYWLRDLTDPLIPEEMYDMCIESAQSFDRIATNILQQLPLIHYRVVEYIVGFLKVFTEERHARLTKMHAENIAMVFAPNFLRCPGNSLTKVFENSKIEQQFVKTLILGMDAPSPPPLYEV